MTGLDSGVGARGEKPGFLKKPGLCSRSVVAGQCVFAARDFIATRERLYFAVVANGVEDGRVPGFLRYAHDGRRFHKLDTLAARRLLKETHPEYLFHSPSRDVDLHGVPVERIERHFVPQARARELQQNAPRDRIERIATSFLQTLCDRGISSEFLGVTGSLLIGAQTRNSDIDVVVSDRVQFQAAREAVRQLLEAGDLEPLSEEFWRAAWSRRGGSLSLEEFIWHERRKFNKLSVEGVKVDLSLALRSPEPPAESYRKLGRVELTARVVDDSQAFDYPAAWRIDSDVAPRVVCWTPTYTGQAFVGETIHLQGWLEESSRGERQVVVGTSREADGELIRVVQHSPET